MKKKFDDVGCTLISKTYLNCKTPLEYICNCGSKYIQTILFNWFKKGARCPECRDKRRQETMMTLYGVTN